MNKTTCYCVINDSAMAGCPPEKVFLSKSRADQYAAHMNDLYFKECGDAVGPYSVEECDLDPVEEVQ